MKRKNGTFPPSSPKAKSRTLKASSGFTPLERRRLLSAVKTEIADGSVMLPSASLETKFLTGFTLIELLVVIALLGSIITLIFIAYRRVSDQLFVTNFSYELALSLRQAQSYGVSVHESTESGVATFDVGYGLHFDSRSLVTYALFADQGGATGDATFNGIFGVAYDATGCLSTTECMSVFRLEKGNRIYKFCGVLPGDGGRDAPDAEKNEECNTLSLPSSNPTIAYLDVVFLRPNPDAIITTSIFGRQYTAARVYLVSSSGDRRVVETANTGQISVN